MMFSVSYSRIRHIRQTNFPLLILSHFLPEKMLTNQQYSENYSSTKSLPVPFLPAATETFPGLAHLTQDGRAVPRSPAMLRGRQPAGRRRPRETRADLGSTAGPAQSRSGPVGSLGQGRGGSLGNRTLPQLPHARRSPAAAGALWLQTRGLNSASTIALLFFSWGFGSVLSIFCARLLPPQAYRSSFKDGQGLENSQRASPPTTRVLGCWWRGALDTRSTGHSRSEGWNRHMR